MATAKRQKKDMTPKKTDETMLAIRYGITIPEKELNDLIKMMCAEKLIELGKSFNEVIEEMRKTENGSVDAIDFLSEFEDVLDVVTSVVSLIEKQWGAIIDQKEKGKKTMKTKKAKKPVESPAKFDLKSAEQAKIRALRKTGMPIKAIGKEIHRAEKVVSRYVHFLEDRKSR